MRDISKGNYRDMWVYAERKGADGSRRSWALATLLRFAPAARGALPVLEQMFHDKDESPQLRVQATLLLWHLKQPPAVWLLGVAGLFFYHALYFTALSHAPPVDASLIAYLWPLLIVLGSALLPGERLRWWHGAGA